MTARHRYLAGISFAAVAMAGPVAADPVMPIPMHVTVSHSTTAFTVCGSGTALSATNVWVLRVTGVRAAGLPVNETVVSFQRGFSECVAVPKAGAVAGSLVATLTYAGSAPDVAGTFGGYGAWAPGVPDQAGDTGIG